MVSHLKGYRNVKILVVDDEDNLRDTVTYNLEREGYTGAGAAVSLSRCHAVSVCLEIAKTPVECVPVQN